MLEHFTLSRKERVVDMKIIVNKIKCKKCGEIIESRCMIFSFANVELLR